MRPWDKHALLRPLFTPEEFTATKFETVDNKAIFANALCKLIASDFKLTLFTEKTYKRLSMCFGHIAHYGRRGFISEFFSNTAGKVEFLEQTMTHPCYGQPEYTHCDVERRVIARLRTCGVIESYRALRAAEAETTKRAQLARLLHKYEGAPQPTERPQTHNRPIVQPSARRAPAVADQRTLL